VVIGSQGPMLFEIVDQKSLSVIRQPNELPTILSPLRSRQVTVLGKEYLFAPFMLSGRA